MSNGAGKSVKFILDGKEVEALDGETIWQVAKRLGIEIPHLCYSPEPGYRPDGNCRVCMVELAAKCRSTTSLAWPAVATLRKSCSISTIRWAIRPALPAANACRPARPGR